MKKSHLKRWMLIMPLTAILLLVGGRNVYATTASMLSDEDLAVSSRAIVRGRVAAGECRFDSTGENIYTYLTIDIEEVIKGDIASRRIVVRQLGGRIGDMIYSVVAAPQFSLKEEALLYLNTADDGALRVAHLFMGKFSVLEDEATRKKFVKRSIGDVKIINESSGEITDYMELDAYIRKIRATLIARAERVAEFDRLNANRPLLESPPEFVSSGLDIKPQFTLLGQPEPGRWHDADIGVPVDYRINSANAPVTGGGLSEAEGALAAWTNIQNASIVLRLVGQSSLCGFVLSDGINNFSFGDCRNDIDDLVNCGGILAFARFVSQGDRRTVNGKGFFRIVDADIVCNNGLNSCNIRPSTFAQLLTHEVGHTIGIGHSSENRNESNPVFKDATMFFLINGDGRGAAVRSDDIAAAFFVYPVQAQTPDFSIAISPGTQTVKAGDAADYAINASLTGGFNSLINFSFANLPPGASVPAFQGDFPLPFRVLTGPMTPPGIYNFTLTGMGGGITRAASAVLIVQSPGPAITGAGFNKPLLRIAGSRFGSAGARVAVNGKDVSARITSQSDTAIELKGNKKKLNLVKGANNVTVTANGMASNTFVFNFFSSEGD